jgi:hypothetical protein
MPGTHQRNVGPMQTAPRCGANTRAGQPCQSPCARGASRCRMHGGKGSGAPHGNRNALKHGAYGKAMRGRAAQVRALLAEARKFCS